jgi:hypothetical protein
MKEPYLEVTFRRGRAIAAYYYLPRRSGQKSHRTVKAGTGMVIDFARDGTPIGIEIIAPSKVSAAGINRVLKRLGFEPVTRAELAPLLAA